MTQMRRISSCSFGEGVEIDVVVMFDGHEGVTIERNAPSARTGDAGEKTAHVQAFE